MIMLQMSEVLLQDNQMIQAYQFSARRETTYTYEKVSGRYRSPKEFPRATSTVSIELSPDKTTKHRQVKSFVNYLS